MAASKVEIVKIFLTQTKSPEEFASYFAEDAVYRMGNREPIVGQNNILESSKQFRSRLKGVSHDIKHIWELGETVVCEMQATYTRSDDSTVTLPCMDVIHFDGDKFKTMKIYMDISPVFAL